MVDSISVNVLSEKILVGLKGEQEISKVVEKLKELGFQISQEPRELAGDQDSKKRTIYLRYSESSPKLQEKLSELRGRPGILSLSDDEQRKLLTAAYNPVLIKARTIFDGLEDLGCQVYNPHLDCFRRKKGAHENMLGRWDVGLSLFIVLFFTIFSMVLPQFEWMEPLLIYPRELNVVSAYAGAMLLLTILVLRLYGFEIFRNCWRNFVSYRLLNMETLITLGSLSAVVMLAYLIVLYQLQDLAEIPDERDRNAEKRMRVVMLLHMLETATLIICIVNIGKYLEGQAKKSIIRMTEEIFPEDSIDQNSQLSYIEPKNRRFLIEREKSYEISLLDREDIVRVRAPMRLLVDGVLVHLSAGVPLRVTDSVCYGWDEKFEPKVGERIKSGAEIVEGEGYLQVESPVEQSMLSKISNQLNLAQNDQEQEESGLSALFSRLSKNFVLGVILVSLATLAGWAALIVTGRYKDEGAFCLYCVPFERAISVLVASCPCALGLAIPSVLVITLNLAMKNQILIKKNNIFEKIHRVGCVVFDKTGTLFTNLDEVRHTVRLESDLLDAEIWEIINILEKDSRHPLGQLLYRESMKEGRSSFIRQHFYPVGDVAASRNGLSVELQKISDGKVHRAMIGNYEMMLAHQVLVTREILQLVEDANRQGRTCLYLAVNQRIVYLLQLDNTANLRPEALEVVHYLQHELGKKVFILSGDARQTVERVGEYLQIPREQLIGEVDAENKRNVLRRIKEEYGSEVMMIGDGLNDILSIQEASIGVSVNAKSELNLKASDVVALNENLWKIASLFRLLRNARRLIILNLLWAFSYNLVMIPFSAGLFVSYGFEVSPILASTFMSGSSLVVVVFSNILKCLNNDPSKGYQGTPSDAQPGLRDESSRQIHLHSTSAQSPQI